MPLRATADDAFEYDVGLALLFRNPQLLMTFHGCGEFASVKMMDCAFHRSRPVVFGKVSAER